MQIDKGAELEGTTIAKDVLKLMLYLAKKDEALSSACSFLEKHNFSLVERMKKNDY